MQIALAPMEGLVDEILRDVLTRMGGADWCVTEFIRVSDRLLPQSSFRKLAPELQTGAITRAGTPVRVQLLGSDPACLADNAAYACSLGAPAIDLNFGCPAKTVNKSRGGAILLREPDLLHAILCEVRRTVPAHIPVTAKMRLGFDSPDGALDCARALVDGGAGQLVVHARTKVEGYKPPAHWEWVARVQEVVAVPVYANGDIWSLEDWRRCREVSGAENIMLGRGLVSRPDLARQIAAAEQRQGIAEMSTTLCARQTEAVAGLAYAQLPRGGGAFRCAASGKRLRADRHDARCQYHGYSGGGAGLDRSASAADVQ